MHERSLAYPCLSTPVFWIVGQGFGGIFTGAATDPNAAPLFCLLAWALYALIPRTRSRATIPP
jgi:hypothetical protein